MKKDEAVQHFTEHIKPLIPQTDKAAIREAWNNYTDFLCKNGDITLRQYENWINPFKE